LLQCTPISVIQAATTGAVLGLEADGATGQGYLVPFRRKGRGRFAQWLTGYKGYNTLAARVGLTINGDVVREGDFFDWEKGSAGFVRHKPSLAARCRGR
jgi:recombination protein RecT